MRVPKDVAMAYMPATFNSNFAMYARGYFAAEALGVAIKTHEQIFDAIWQGGLAPKDIDGLANLYQRVGVDREQFLSAAKSMGVEARLRDATSKSERMKIEGTPTIYVDGKYQLLTTGAQSYDEAMARLDALIAKARADRRAKP
jgi:thiol:disulfide interchange protein DsbA